MVAICPICQSNNQCGIDRQEPCWCTTMDFSAIHLEKHQLPNVCICPHCAKQLGAEMKHRSNNYPQKDKLIHK